MRASLVGIMSLSVGGGLKYKLLQCLDISWPHVTQIDYDV